jgi:hypothetical protein
MNYPTDWQGGLAQGSIKLDQSGRNYQVTIQSKGVRIYESFNIENHGGKEACYEIAAQFRALVSSDMGLSRNQYRYIDENTIEVQLTKGKTCFMDATPNVLEMVNQYPLQAKHKVEIKDDEKLSRYYVCYQTKRRAFPFTGLIYPDYKIIKYIDGNTMNLRATNIKNFGTKLNTVQNVNDIPEDINPNDIYMEDMYQYYNMSFKKLPKYKWILGTPAGTVFYRSENKGKIITVSVDIPNQNKKTAVKTFKVSDYNSKTEAWNDASKYMINLAHHLNNIKNKIRICDNDIIEVMIDEINIMKTNLCFLPLFIPFGKKWRSHITISTTHSQINQKLYAAAHLRNVIGKKMTTFHKLIMGSSMIDHINGDALDNRLENLRWTSYEHNNTNRIQTTENVTGTRFLKNAWHALIKSDGIIYSKSFNVNKYGNELARELAIKFRKNILELNPITDISEIEFSTKNDVKILKNVLKRITEYNHSLIERSINNKKNYMERLKLDIECPDAHHKMYMEYTKHLASCLFLLEEKYAILKNVLDELKLKLNKNKIVNTQQIYDI